MAEERQVTEQQYLSVLSDLAGTSITWVLNTQKGKLYFLTDNLFSEMFYDGAGMANNHNLEGNTFPNGLEAFVEEKATNPDCIGLVPLTKRAQAVITQLGLKITIKGIAIAPENYQGMVYSIEQPVN